MATPFYPQALNQYQCGPASLATVLNASGLDVEPEQLTKEIYIPKRKGSLQVEIVAAVRQHDRIPYDPGDNVQALMEQLQNNQPVLVLLNLGLKMVPIYHYAVIVGYEPNSDSIIMRSGTDYRLLMPRKRFLAAWDRAGSWALVTLPPGKLPDNVNIERYIKAIVATESVGQLNTAEQGYRAILSRSPNNILASFGLANTLHAQGKFEAAAEQYSRLLLVDENHKPARNNLADTYLKLGRCDQAFATLTYIVNMNDSVSVVDRAIAQTYSDIQENCPHL